MMLSMARGSLIALLCLQLCGVEGHGNHGRHGKRVKRQTVEDPVVAVNITIPIVEPIVVGPQGIPVEVSDPLPVVTVTLNDQVVSTNTTNGTIANEESLALSSIVVSANTVSSTVLVIARDTAAAFSATSGLISYGIPYQILVVPQAGVDLPTLNSSTSHGNYGAIVIISEVSYDYGTVLGYQSALSTDQWTTLYSYQVAFGVRMVRIDVYPGPASGTTTSGGCCSDGTEQLISISNTDEFPTSGLKTGATMSTAGLWHYPATITNSTIATEFAQFGPTTGFETTSTAGVINNIDGRQQIVFFISWAAEWSATTAWLQHTWITWATRGLYVGHRRINLGTQIDDMFLITDIYYPAGETFRIRTGDLDAHKTWTDTINSELSPGSNFFIELAHNGNGNVEAGESASSDDEESENSVCGIGPIYYDWPGDTELEFQKVVGTGVNNWPASPVAYPEYADECLDLDDLKVWLTSSENLDAFAHISHTFTHLALNNATYFDATQEISWNRAWLTASGIASASKFSTGLVPPAITGLHNGDAIRAWVENGVNYAVGDNTRPVLLNTENPHWPLISTVEANGYAGFTIIPRWASAIYYNCDTAQCTLNEWIATSAGSGDIDNLLAVEKAANTRRLLGLHHDPFMFHQANLRQTDAEDSVINGVTAQRSIFQMWVETITQELTRLTNWPIITLKHDDIGASFVARATRDACVPKLDWILNSAANTITGVTVSTNGNTCGTAVPVTLPGSVTDTQGFTTEQIGNDPLTIWVTLSGSPVSFTLTTPVSL